MTNPAKAENPLTAETATIEPLQPDLLPDSLLDGCPSDEDSTELSCEDGVVETDVGSEEVVELLSGFELLELPGPGVTEPASGYTCLHSFATDVLAHSPKIFQAYSG